MTIQQIVAELENIKEQTLNNSKITTDDVIEAIDDIISDCKDNSMDFTFEDEDDYGPGNISVGTQLQTPEEVNLSLTGLWFRMNDKIQRLKTLLMGNKDSAVDEPLEDAYLDVSNYGIMATIVKNGKWGK